METYRIKLPPSDVEALKQLARQRSFLKSCDVSWQAMLRESVSRMLAAETLPGARRP